MANYKAKLPKITTFIFDFDGVMSDGRVWLVDEENQIRNTNVKDGYALHHAVKKGYHVAVISGGKGHSLHMRMSFLGVKDVFTQVSYKKDCGGGNPGNRRLHFWQEGGRWLRAGCDRASDAGEGGLVR